MSLHRHLFGEDVFISYARQDGMMYASGLAALLAQRLAVRVDLWEAEPGRTLPDALRRALRRCNLLIVLATPGGCASPHVAEEIAEYRRSHPKPRIVVVSFAEAARGCRWSADVEGLPQEVERNPDALDTGAPSRNVLDRITHACTFTRREDRLRRSAALLIATTGVVIAIGSVVVWGLRREAARLTLANEGRQSATTAEQLRLQAAALGSRWGTVAQQAAIVALEANSKFDSFETTQAMRGVLGLLPRQATRLAALEQPRLLSFSADGRVLAAYASDALFLYRVLTRTPIRRLPANGLDDYALSADGRWLAIVRNRTFELWSVDSGDNPRWSRTIRQGAHAFNHRPIFAGSLVAAASSDGAFAWDVSTGTLRVRLAAGSGLDGMALSVDGVIAATTRDKQVCIWNIPAGTHRCFTFDRGVYSVDFSGKPDEPLLAAAVGATVRVWNAARGTEVRRFANPDPTVYFTGVRLSADGRSAGVIEEAFADPDGPVQVWDVQNGELVDYLQDEDDTTRVLSPDRRFGIAAGESGIRVWDLTTGKTVARAALQDALEVQAFAYHSSGLLAVGTPGDLWLYDTRRRDEVGPLTASSSGVRTSADHRYAASTGSPLLDIWDPATGEVVASLPHDGPVKQVAFSDDGQFVVTADAGGRIRLWALPSGTLQRTIDGIPAVAMEEDSDGDERETPNVKALHFSPRAGFITILTVSGAEVWHRMGPLAFASTRSERPVFSADEQWAAVETKEGTELHELPDGETVRYPGWRPLGVAPDNTFALSDGQRVRVATPGAPRMADAVACMNTTPREIGVPLQAHSFASGRLLVQCGDRIVVSDVRTSRELARISLPDRSFTFHLDPTERFIAVDHYWGNGVHPTDVWAVDGRHILQIPHGGRNYGVAFSRDGAYVATTSADGAVSVGDLRRGVLLPVLGHVGSVSHPTFSPDSRYLAAQSDTLGIQVWRLPDLAEVARVGEGTVSDIWFDARRQIWDQSDRTRPPRGRGPCR